MQLALRNVPLIATKVLNNILTNLYLGISVNEQAHPLLDSNVLQSCYTGISYLDSSSGEAVNNQILDGNSGILISSPATPSISNNYIQALSYSLISEPPEYIYQLDLHDNDLHDGPPEVIIWTITPTP